ncbi:polyprenyl synthetase family protein [Edaphobacter sp. 12200R-103]|uniref:polyprenyl synthetase family protein n=1 Tax=Edaphobacter sp. 12200R-103 TaxID=2703788 RepID=UPI00138CB050|nr:polyprenyl synthetase family protein [Edaphobacter sp. 12200R-103]QHS50649.1 polyprenyl synthetase family protein [Edaphobacter sp. 12200R-103]
MSTLSIATAAEVFDLLREDLAAIEQEFSKQSASNVAVITDIAQYLIAGGGKRIRPLLLLLAAKSLGSTGHSRIRLGAVVEMLHTATLVHDDIIDEADTRRGRPSSNTTWGNSKCVLAGDWLYMQAFSSALEERNFHVLDLLISLTQQMVEGELLQIEKLGHLINEEEYFDLIYRKTACLFKVSMQLGAAITPHDFGDANVIEAQLGEYGRNLGLAFQIVDDVLDLTAAEEVLGKPVASDLREGKATLAVIHALERGTGADREAIRTVLADRSFARVSHSQIIEVLRRHGSIEYAMDTACAYAEAARQSIADLPPSDAKRALLWVPGFVTSRDR